MRELDRRSTAGGGVRIAWRLWGPDAGATVGRVLVAHGYGEHGGRYHRLGERLAAAGIETAVPDHRGHGRSDGRRVSVARFDEYVDDLGQVASDLVSEEGAAPTVVFGHSMGGLIATLYALRHQAELCGLALSAPLLVAGRVPRPTLMLGRLLARVAPGMGVMRLPLNAVSRDPDVVAAYFADPLVNARPIRAGLGVEMLRAIAEADSGLPRLTLPVLVMQGTADRLVDPSAAGHVHQRVASADRTIHTYPGLFHEILNEPERETVLDDLVGWIVSRLAAGSAVRSR
jgi:acylglycerol lipase